MAEIKAVIFDLDDTLYPERAYAQSGFAAVAQAYAQLGSADTVLAEMIELLDSPFRSTLFDELLRRKGKTDSELLKGMIKTYRTHAPTLQLFPDAAAALSRLRSSFRFGLISDGRREGQRAKVDALQLRSRMDEIILTDELGAGFAKPHPRAFDLIAKRLAVAPGNCVFVADNASKDFVSPNALGWLSVHVTRPTGLYVQEQPPPGGEPQHAIESLDALDDLLGNV
jgi:putative hydrolase of the HAD superfamily